MDVGKICAIIVTYRYGYDKLFETVTAIARQVGHVCLVDNNGSQMPDVLMPEYKQLGCTVIANPENVGLAGAINQGIRFAAEARFEQVLLLDQDSQAASNMVERLTAARRNLFESHEKVAAVGPVIVDRHRGAPFPFLQFRPTGIRKILPVEDTALVPVDYLITSGSLIEIDALPAVGMMDESLFIDSVDMDWCFRAKKAGYKLYGVPGAVLYHRLGEDACRLPFTGRSVWVHKPERQYYIIRNRLLLYRRNYIPFAFKIQDVLRVVSRLLFFSLLVPQRRKNVRMMMRGIIDGLSGRSNNHLKGMASSGVKKEKSPEGCFHGGESR